MEMLHFALVLAVSSRMAFGANMACQEVRYAYSAKGMNVYDVPLKPQTGVSLQICPTGPTCCTPDMEERLNDWSAAQYKEALARKTDEMAMPFRSKATKLDDFMMSVFGDSQRTLHDTFMQTYGHLYEKNSDLFEDFFKELRRYYERGNDNLFEITNKLFSKLYKRMFQVINSQYQFDDNYMMCVAQHMDEVMPFGEDPRKLASTVKRSMVAVRALEKALRSGFTIAEEMKKIPISDECMKAVQKMNSCPACQGFPELRPCSNYCINVMKGCLAFHIETQDMWDKFVDSMLTLSDRLAGPFNAENVILPLDVSISEAIMNFQESGFKITQTVFEKCGTPRLVKRSASTNIKNDNDMKLEINSNERSNYANENEFGFEEKQGDLSFSRHNKRDRQRHIRRHRNQQSNSNRYSNKKFVRSWDVSQPRKQPEKSQFETVIQDIRQSVRQSQGFWRHLPYSLCASSQETLFSRVLRESRNAEIRDDNLRNSHHGVLSSRKKESLSTNGRKENNEKLCWNGKDSTPYDSDVIEDGLINQANNPEVALNTAGPPEIVRDQIYKLQSITNQLKQAHRGQDVEWWDEEEESLQGDSYVMNDGSGDDAVEGSGRYYPDDDDEDHVREGSGCEDCEGSGMEEECGEWPLNPCKGPWETPVEPTRPTTEIYIVDNTPKSNIEPKITIAGSGAGSVRVKPWSNKNPVQMIMAISRFIVPQFAIGLGWYVTHGVAGISFYSSRTQTSL